MKHPNSHTKPVPNPSSGPRRKTVFKVYSGKLPYSQNTVEGCVLCLEQRGPGDKSLPLCSGCRSVRFCSREHQIQFWPKHKDFCKQQAEGHKEMDRLREGPQHLCGLPSLSERKVILEDWIELHRNSIEEALASAIYTSEQRFDFKKQFAHFVLDYRIESGGNPSTAYTLRSLNFITEPSPSPFAVFRKMVEDADVEERGSPGYVGYLICNFSYNNEMIPWLTAMPVLDKDLRSLSIAEHKDWFLPLQSAVNQGLVYRLIGRSETEWTPGLMEKQDSKHWVWQPKTLEELEEQGIRRVTPESLSD